MDCHKPALTIVILTIGVASIGFQYGGGFLLNHVDIAPKYASVLFGLSNTAATIPGFIVPVAISALTPNVSIEVYGINRTIHSDVLPIPKLLLLNK